jgi:hypothetical protein
MNFLFSCMNLRSHHYMSFTSLPYPLDLSDILAVQDVNESSVRRLLLETIVPQKSRTLTTESSWHPAVSVLDTL